MLVRWLISSSICCFKLSLGESGALFVCCAACCCSRCFWRAWPSSRAPCIRACMDICVRCSSCSRSRGRNPGACQEGCASLSRWGACAREDAVRLNTGACPAPSCPAACRAAFCCALTPVAGVRFCVLSGALCAAGAVLCAPPPLPASVCPASAAFAPGRPASGFLSPARVPRRLCSISRFSLSLYRCCESHRPACCPFSQVSRSISAAKSSAKPSCRLSLSRSFFLAALTFFSFPVNTEKAASEDAAFSILCARRGAYSV